MQIVRTFVWVLVAVALALFAAMNWQVVTVKIWEGLLLETKLPVLLVAAFLLGLVPMWLYHRAVRWGMARRVALLENSLRAAEPAVLAHSASPEGAAAQATTAPLLTEPLP